jgi:hypothetical protein
MTHYCVVRNQLQSKLYVFIIRRELPLNSINTASGFVPDCDLRTVYLTAQELLPFHNATA